MLGLELAMLAKAHGLKVARVEIKALTRTARKPRPRAAGKFFAGLVKNTRDVSGHSAQITPLDRAENINHGSDIVVRENSHTGAALN